MKRRAAQQGLPAGRYRELDSRDNCARRIATVELPANVKVLGEITKMARCETMSCGTGQEKNATCLRGYTLTHGFSGLFDQLHR